MITKNAKTLPKVFFGLHFSEGVAEYREHGKEPYRIFLNESTIKKMDPSFQGRPVYVQHVEEVDLSKIQEEADGYVVRSFYNAADGKHWVEFIVVSDKGHEAVRNGWKLSNAYIPKEFAPGGQWHGVDYLKEVMSGEYEHLAIVNNPRYAESIILSPEQFKEYNERKHSDIKRLSNSKENGEKSMFDFFKRTKVENSAELETTMVVLPKSKKELSVTQIINELDTVYNMQGYAHPDHMVKMNDSEEMSVKDMVDCYNSMKSEMEKMKNKDMDGGEKEAEGQKKEADKTEMKNDEEMDGGEKKAASEEKKADKTENEIENDFFKALKNAPMTAIKEPLKVDLDKVARGQARYGSN